eukprot:TRINITY_DN92079_c0_g1_i1.p1 TRINITY_DN92079_c0_g1~~TRINITY_DN92079_c0_g1_i1.p1  ORF type:complete len:368 (+),score=38.07 TRINITY_DN92079_c0_g1_i1:45-1148(+)
MPLGTLAEVLEHHAHEHLAEPPVLVPKSRAKQQLAHFAFDLGANPRPLRLPSGRRHGQHSAFGEFLVMEPSDAATSDNLQQEDASLQSHADGDPIVDYATVPGSEFAYPVRTRLHGASSRALQVSGTDANSEVEHGSRIPGVKRSTEQGLPKKGGASVDDERLAASHDTGVTSGDGGDSSLSDDALVAESDDPVDAIRSLEHQHGKLAGATRVIVITNMPEQHVVQHLPAVKATRPAENVQQFEAPAESQDAADQAPRDVTSEDRGKDEDTDPLAAKEWHIRPSVVAGGALALCAQVYLWGTVFVTLYKPARRAESHVPSQAVATADAARANDGPPLMSTSGFPAGAAVGRLGEDPQPHADALPATA